MLNGMKEYQVSSQSNAVSRAEVEQLLDGVVRELPEASSILLVPPDITRCYSYSGPITAYLYRRLSAAAHVDIMPALGTHRAMTREEQVSLFGADIPEEAYLYHDWRRDTVEIGTVPAEAVKEMTDGKCVIDVPVEVDRRVVDGSYDLIISIGQVVPHEVVGMANYSKNILVGLGGRHMINKSHMIGAICNMEKIMGNTDSPVRALFDYGESHFLKQVPLAYVLTVTTQKAGEAVVHGVFAGASRRVFEQACELARATNIIHVPRRAKKVVAYLEPEEFSTTWVGNKAVYRTRMMIADGGQLLVIAPGLKAFGENPEVDTLIRRYGYRGTPYTMKLMEQGVFHNAAMAAAHMIHSSSEGRFGITYAVNPDYISKEEMEQAGYGFMDVKEALERYPILDLPDGFVTMDDGEEIFVVKAPALGLWKTE